VLQPLPPVSDLLSAKRAREPNFTPGQAVFHTWRSCILASNLLTPGWCTGKPLCMASRHKVITYAKEHSNERIACLPALFCAASALLDFLYIVQKASYNNREISLQVTKTTYSGLQEHRMMVYTATVVSHHCSVARCAASCWTFVAATPESKMNIPHSQSVAHKRVCVYIPSRPGHQRRRKLKGPSTTINHGNHRATPVNRSSC
jgi:hypothetical protein